MPVFSACARPLVPCSSLLSTSKKATKAQPHLLLEGEGQSGSSLKFVLPAASPTVHSGLLRLHSGRSELSVAMTNQSVPVGVWPKLEAPIIRRRSPAFSVLISSFENHLDRPGHSHSTFSHRLCCIMISIRKRRGPLL